MSVRKLALANLRANLGRTAGMAVLVAALAFVALGGLLVTSSLSSGLSSLEARLGADIIVAPDTAKSHNDLEEVLVEGVPGQFYMDASYVDKIAEREGVEIASPQYYLATMKAGCCSMPVQVIGFDPATDFTVQPWIARSYGGDLGLNQVVVGCNISGAVGAQIQLYGVTCEIVSKLDETGTKLDNAVFATGDTVRNLINAAVERGFPPDSHEDPTTRISTVQVKVADGYNVESVADDINLHVRGVTAVQTRAMTSGVADGVAGMAGIVHVLMAVLCIVALVVLVAAFTVAGRHRAREFAILRVVGASRKMLLRVVLTESLVLSMAGALVGVLLAVAVVGVFNGTIEQALGLPFLMPDAGSIALYAIGVFAVAAIAGALASAVSARRLSRVDAGQTLREE